jgi:hypothetical protein
MKQWQKRFVFKSSVFVLKVAMRTALGGVGFKAKFTGRQENWFFNDQIYFVLLSSEFFSPCDS